MTQVFGILGFFLGLLAIFLVSEFTRRSSQNQVKLEAEVFRSKMRIEELESKVLKVDRMTTEMHHQKKRQAETLTSMAHKGEVAMSEEKPRKKRLSGSGARFTPSEYNHRKSG